jgi:hypothetical protein
VSVVSDQPSSVQVGGADVAVFRDFGASTWAPRPFAVGDLRSESVKRVASVVGERSAGG